MKLGYYAGTHIRNNVFTFLQENLERNPNGVVFRWVAQKTLSEWLQAKERNETRELLHEFISLKDFTERVKSAGAGFQKLGIQHGDRVILFLPMSVEMYASMFGLQMIGAIPVFLDTWARRGHLGVTAAVVEPKAMISVQGAFELIADLPEFENMKHKIAWGQCTVPNHISLSAILNSTEKAQPTAVEQEHTALITFTTGSSGIPKGADRSHRFLAAQHYAINECLPYTEHDADLPAFPVFSLNNIAAGVETIIPAIDVGTPRNSDGAVLLAQINACKISCMTLSPSLLNSLTNHAVALKIKLPFVRRLAAGGAPISRDNVAQFKLVAPNCALWVLYGSTEVEPIAHLEADEILKQERHHDTEIVEPGVFVGHYASGLKHKLIKIHKDPIQISSEEDWKNWEVANGLPGELIVAGEHVCRNYFRNDAAFASSKIRDPDLQTVWHRTGDIGQNISGVLCIVGRIHNVIQRKGKLLFPVRPEVILKRVPGIRDAGYLGLKNGTDEKTVVVFSLQKNSDTKELSDKVSEIISEVNRLFSKNDIPFDFFAVLDSIPLDARHHSKVEYDVLRKFFTENPTLLKKNPLGDR
jgi:olefin beta-lactone synthetase